MISSAVIINTGHDFLRSRDQKEKVCYTFAYKESAFQAWSCLDPHTKGDVETLNGVYFLFVWGMHTTLFPIVFGSKHCLLTIHGHSLKANVLLSER